MSAQPRKNSARDGAAPGKHAVNPEYARGVRPMNEEEFAHLSNYLNRTLGIRMRSEKRVTVHHRLAGHVRELGLRTYGDYFNYVASDSSGATLSEMINRVTTNHTFFLREDEHFEYLRAKVFPEFSDSAPIRIWSAACSTGDEAYTIAIELLEYFGPGILQRDCAILATDISRRVVETARRGIFSAERVASLPIKIRERYFTKLPKDRYEIKEGPRKLVTFGVLNLNREQFPFKKQFDVVFLRNVLIYFDPGAAIRTIDNISRYLRPGGTFILGKSETMDRSLRNFKMIRHSVYRYDGRSKTKLPGRLSRGAGDSGARQAAS